MSFDPTAPVVTDPPPPAAPPVDARYDELVAEVAALRAERSGGGPEPVDHWAGKLPELGQVITHTFANYYADNAEHVRHGIVVGQVPANRQVLVAWLPDGLAQLPADDVAPLEPPADTAPPA